MERLHANMLTKAASTSLWNRGIQFCPPDIVDSSSHRPWTLAILPGEDPNRALESKRSGAAILLSFCWVKTASPHFSWNSCLIFFFRGGISDPKWFMPVALNCLNTNPFVLVYHRLHYCQGTCNSSSLSPVIWEQGWGEPRYPVTGDSECLQGGPHNSYRWVLSCRRSPHKTLLLGMNRITLLIKCVWSGLQPFPWVQIMSVPDFSPSFSA